MDLGAFSIEEHKTLASIIKEYVSKYRVPPTYDTLKGFLNERLTQENVDKYVSALELIHGLPKVELSEADFYFNEAENLRMGRIVYDTQNKLVESLEKPATDFIKLRQTILKDLLIAGKDVNNIRRGFIYNNVKDRYNLYKKAESGISEEIIPFGITKVDEVIGGMRKTFVTLIYSKTAGGKSRLAINVAYNAANAKHNVMYISLEMAYDLLASCFDSRIAAVDSHKILFGKLDKDGKKKYIQALKDQVNNKLNIWIADIPMGATVSLVMEELEIYKAANGVYPDLIIADYANLLEPTKRYKDRSEKYDHLMKELHEMARSYNFALLTMMQESRDASKSDIEGENGKKKKNVEGVHNIGLSNFAAIHCETVLRLKQSEEDTIRNRLWVHFDKNRYGSSMKRVPIFAAWDVTYVGDRSIQDPTPPIIHIPESTK